MIVQVLSITPHGIWVSLQGEELFMRHEQFPWFLDAAVVDVFNMESLGRYGVRWPRLDIDLSIDSIRHPDRFPLIAKH